ncbi:MAG: hypothetical protein ACI9RO_000411 [Alteromonas macleodii]|jgi:hypothetical protein
MFTIEHDYDSTVITLVDDGEVPLREDVKISAFEDCIIVNQIDPHTYDPVTIKMSMAQLRDLSSALDLPEGSYRFREAG